MLRWSTGLVCPALVASITVITSLIQTDHPSAQQSPLHLNPVVEKLAQGKPVFGVSTTDFSIDNANAMARSDVDFMRFEMEHAPMDFDTVRNFLIGMIDKAGILKKGNAQLNVAPLIRIAPYGRDRADWVVKQALDVGVMGVIFPTVDNKEQTLAAVRSMRYPQRRGSPYMQPAGLRGVGATNALWFWGVGTEDYTRRADLWPLNPQGDLLAIIMIESVEGMKNLDEILSVPGVGLLWAGIANDLSMSMGVPQDSPEVEGALGSILKACLKHGVPCGINASAGDIQKRIKEGWKYFDVGRVGAGMTPPVDAALRAGRAGLK